MARFAGPSSAIGAIFGAFANNVYYFFFLGLSAGFMMGAAYIVLQRRYQNFGPKKVEDDAPKVESRRK